MVGIPRSKFGQVRRENCFAYTPIELLGSMSDTQRERGNEPVLMKILEKIKKNEAQQILLETTLNIITLLQSWVLSSPQYINWVANLVHL